MKHTLSYLLLLVGAASVTVFPGTQPRAQQTPDFNAFYQIGPDSLAHDGVPKGEVRGPFFLPSQAYPGTQHTYWIHVPAQYDPAVAASLMIFQDGQAFKDMDGVVRAPNVLDNLIYRREIPVMITVFINPGRTPEQSEPTPSNWGDRDTNRPTEYNTLDDKYARVVVDELLPVLYRDYNISKDPDRHGIGGASSGAIAAFTVAWQRPNDFRKVLSIVGSFVNLRGGDAYADIVRQTDKKPIRIFLQDGRNDNRGVGRGGEYDPRRDWFYQNVRLMEALTMKGYDVNYTWGMNTHGQRMGGPILPEMMRWLWRDHPVSTDVNNAIERSFSAPRPSAAADHQRVLELFQIASLPPGPRSSCPETYDENAANPFPTLPDPLVMKNGAKVTSAAMWKQRRSEILEDFEREIYGRTPKVTPKVAWKVTNIGEGTTGDVPTITKTLVGHVDNSAYPAIAVDIQATLTLPKRATGPVPVMLVLGPGGVGPRPPVPVAARGPATPVACDNAVARAFAAAAAANPPATPAAPAAPPAVVGASPGSAGPNQTQILLLSKGWGYATVNTSSIQADNGAGLTQGIIGLVNKGQHRRPDDWGALSAWAWGASRVLDSFETDKAVDARRVGVEGHSRWGKATLLAMALDERFAIAYVSSSGEGGAKLHRRKYGELVQNVAAANEYHWMAENHMKYADKWDAMPVDSHELVALCAPRPVFLSTGRGPDTNPDGTIAIKPDGSAVSINDAWVDAKGTFLAGAGASPVYRLLRKRPLATSVFPAIETLVDGDVAFRQHGGGHTDGPNWPVFLAWAERHVSARGPGTK